MESERSEPKKIVVQVTKQSQVSKEIIQQLLPTSIVTIAKSPTTTAQNANQSSAYNAREAPPLVSIKALKVIAPKPITVELPTTNKHKANVKLVKASSLMKPNNMEISPEMLLMSNLMKEFGKQGISFNQPMLQIINTFCKETKKICADQCKALNAEISTLGKKVEAQQQEIASLQHKIEQEKSNQHSDKHLTSLLSTIRDLNAKFLVDIESNVRDTLKFSEISANSQAVVENTPETLSSLSGKLIELLDTAGEDEKTSNLIKINPLFERLCLYVNVMESYTLESEQIDQIQPFELLKDVNMGVEIKIPRMQPQQNARTIFVRELFRYLQVCRNEINASGDRLIHEAVVRSDFEEVRKHCVAMKLLSLSIDICNDDLQTPLHLAIINNASIEVICTLLKYRANILLCDGDGCNVLHLAVLNESLGRLLDPSVRELVDERILQRMVNKFNHEGYAPIHLAAIGGRKEAIEDLLALKADIDLCDMKSGRTAMYHAIENNHMEVVSYLKDCNADINVKNYAGVTIIDTLADADSDYSNEIKMLFYNDRARVLASRKSEVEKSSLHARRSKRALMRMEMNAKKRKKN